MEEEWGIEDLEFVPLEEADWSNEVDGIILCQIGDEHAAEGKVINTAYFQGEVFCCQAHAEDAKLQYIREAEEAHEDFLEREARLAELEAEEA